MPLAYRTQLLSREPRLTIWKIGMPGVPPSGTLDPEILLWCEGNDFILVTNNRKSMPVHLADHLAAGRGAQISIARLKAAAEARRRTMGTAISFKTSRAQQLLRKPERLGLFRARESTHGAAERHTGT